ncbi:MAG: hypothetical protein AAB625_02375 [Patescibacteria group bacterium]
MTKRKKREKGILLEEHPNRPGYPDLIGHRQLRIMKMGVVVRGKGIIESLENRLKRSKKELGLDVADDNFGERRI